MSAARLAVAGWTALSVLWGCGGDEEAAPDAASPAGPGSMPARLELARQHLHRDEFVEAIAVCEAALEEDSTSADFLNLLATAYGFTTAIIILTIVLSLIALLVSIASIIFGSVVTLFIDDFVVPIMYLKKLRILQAWKVFRGLLSFNKTHFFLYVLFKSINI